MLGSAIISKAYRLTNKSATTFLDGVAANILAEVNTAYGHRVLDIIRIGVDKNASIQKATTTLVSTAGLSAGDNGYNGEYAFPTDLLRPIRLEVSYDGVTWTKAQIYDNGINTGSEYNESQVEGSFSSSRPRVDFNRNSYTIRPPKTSAGNIANGIYIEYELRQEDITTSDAPVEIEDNLHDLLAYDLAEQEFIMHSDKYTDTQYRRFQIKRGEVEQKFEEFYRNRFKTPRRMTPVYNNYR